jgi:hypothetical protein
MQPKLIPARTDDAIAFLSERAQAARDVVSYHAESREELVADMAKARLAKKLATLAPIDLIGGLHSATLEKHGDALRGAWKESPEAFGAMVMVLVRDQLADEANLEAEEALAAIEAEARAEAAPRHRTFLIAGV